MTTIQKTIHIPPNHRVSIDLSLPEELPVGDADITVTISPKQKKKTGKTLTQLAGALAHSKALEGDAVPLVRQWRDEW